MFPKRLTSGFHTHIAVYIDDNIFFGILRVNPKYARFHAIFFQNFFLGWAAPQCHSSVIEVCTFVLLFWFQLFFKGSLQTCWVLALAVWVALMQWMDSILFLVVSWSTGSILSYPEKASFFTVVMATTAKSSNNVGMCWSTCSGMRRESLSVFISIWTRLWHSSENNVVILVLKISLQASWPKKLFHLVSLRQALLRSNSASLDWRIGPSWYRNCRRLLRGSACVRFNGNQYRVVLWCAPTALYASTDLKTKLSSMHAKHMQSKHMQWKTCAPTAASDNIFSPPRHFPLVGQLQHPAWSTACFTTVICSWICDRCICIPSVISLSYVVVPWTFKTIFWVWKHVFKFMVWACFQQSNFYFDARLMFQIFRAEMAKSPMSKFLAFCPSTQDK